MAKSPQQKLKLLYLAQVLKEQTDEQHPLSVQELILKLEQNGISAERKSIYDDMLMLQKAGMDVVTVRGRCNSYFIGSRDFELAELKLLVDAVQASRFITAKKSRILIKKITSLASAHEAKRMARQVVSSGQTKPMNESIYYSVDEIHQAISQNRQISFRYYEWVVSSATGQMVKKRWRHGGLSYVVSPWALLWDNEFYYLVAYDAAAGFIKHYRVDKMDGVKAQKIVRQGRDVFAEIDLASYTRGTFGMFGGEETMVTLRFSNRLVGVVLDRFGKTIHLQKDGDAHFTLLIPAVVSAPFLSWLFGFGNEVEVLSPNWLIVRIREEVEILRGMYLPLPSDEEQ